ncbi:MAG: dihydrolipoamide acetyltransferase family protein [Halanaerobium sp.]
MAKELLMPKLGLTMEEGTLIEWYISEGDSFKEGDLIFAVETEKLTNDVEATQSGELLEILVKEGETVPVKTPVARLVGYEAEAGEQEPAAADKDANTEESAKKREVPNKAEKEEQKSSTKKVMAAPKARKIAADNNLDLQEVAAELSKNRLSVSDIEKYLDSQTDKDKKEVKQKGAEHKSSSMRKIIGERLSESWRSPHIYLKKEIDVGALICVKESMADNGIKISLNDIITYITAKVLADYKVINKVEKETGDFVIADEVSVGVAVAVDNGLLVPVLKNTDQLSLKEVSAKSSDLVKRTKNNNLNPDELQGGSFTISNLGMFGIDEFTAIINPPQTAILAVGTVKDRLYLDLEKRVKNKKVINFTLGVDHRAVDGAEAAKFMQKFAAYVENPYLCL